MTKNTEIFVLNQDEVMAITGGETWQSTSHTWYACLSG